MKKIIQIINGFFTKPNKHSRNLIDIPDIPDKEVIECEIETPQFHGSQDKFYMYKQTGKFYKYDMKFIHDGILTGHDVQFHNMKDFRKALLRVFP